MIHVHVRDRDQRHLLDAEAYRSATAEIRAVTGDRLVIQVTSESLGYYTPQQQMDVVRAVHPQAVSLALRELAPDESHEKDFVDFLVWLKKESIAPQIILYEPSEALRLDRMRKRGTLPFEEPPVLYAVGRYAESQTAIPNDVIRFVESEMPVFKRFMFCAFGPHEAACTTFGALLGGGVRVGFENNVMMPDGSTASSNAMLVAEARKRLEALNVPMMSAHDLAQDWSRL